MVIAVAAALSLFVIPVDLKNRVFVMDWETETRLPWGLLLLFGGGLSLAATICTNKVGECLGHQIGAMANVPELFIIVAVVTLMTFLTELTSNTATTVTLVPILCALAVPATIAATGSGWVASRRCAAPASA